MIGGRICPPVEAAASTGACEIAGKASAADHRDGADTGADHVGHALPETVPKSAKAKIAA